MLIKQKNAPMPIQTKKDNGLVVQCVPMLDCYILINGEKQEPTALLKILTSLYNGEHVILDKNIKDWLEKKQLKLVCIESIPQIYKAATLKRNISILEKLIKDLTQTIQNFDDL